MVMFSNFEGEFEGGQQPYQLDIYMKNGENLWIVNRLDALVEITDQLMCDNEYDGGDNTVEIRGVKLLPNVVQTMLFIKPWAVAAVEMSPVTMERCREMAAKAKKEGLI
jgi:hypothetical protein